MVQLTCIYTRSGDRGKTSLGNGERVSKSSYRIESIGSVDEVNCFIGLTLLQPMPQDVFDLLRLIQNNLFDLGADLCMPDPDDALDYVPLRIKQEKIDFIEKQIDLFNADLKPLNSFVLPGGTEASAYMHCARTITRRAERIVCTLQEIENESELSLVIMYLNRLSDLFFVLGRFLNQQGEGDILWQPGK